MKLLFDQCCLFEKIASEPSDRDIIDWILKTLEDGKSAKAPDGTVVKRIKPKMVDVGTPWNPRSMTAEYVVILPSGHKRFFAEAYRAAEEALKMSGRSLDK